jgi:hypothetical protein
MNVRNEHLAYRPGGISAFFVYKAGFMAASFWAWLAVLAGQAGTISAWHLVAATGAITTTLVAVILGVRHALAKNAASRHEQIMHTLVELSWQDFGTPVAAASAGETDAEVIRLPHELRPHPRR